MRNTCWMLASMVALGLAARAQAGGPDAGATSRQVADLTRALEGNDDSAKRRALEQLGRLGTSANPAADALLALLERDPACASGALHLLVRLGRTEAIPAICRHLPDASATRRADLARALGRLGAIALAPLGPAMMAFGRPVGAEALTRSAGRVVTAAERLAASAAGLTPLFGDADPVVLRAAARAFVEVSAGWARTRPVLEDGSRSGALAADATYQRALSACAATAAELAALGLAAGAQIARLDDAPALPCAVLRALAAVATPDRELLAALDALARDTHRHPLLRHEAGRVLAGLRGSACA